MYACGQLLVPVDALRSLVPAGAVGIGLPEETRSAATSGRTGEERARARPKASSISSRGPVTSRSGETDKAYDWVTAFERTSGCKVNVKTAGTSDEMVSLMTQGGYDLVTASGDASLRLIRGNTVQPIDISRVPSYGTVDKRLQEAPWHFVDGKHYGTPYQWGPNVLMYNTKVFKAAPTSWSVVLRAAETSGRQA